MTLACLVSDDGSLCTRVLPRGYLLLCQVDGGLLACDVVVRPLSSALHGEMSAVVGSLPAVLVADTLPVGEGRVTSL